MIIGAAQHTIVLVQFFDKLSSRTFSDFESVEKAMDGVCQLFEQKLKSMHPNRHKITYDISELFEYLDQLKDLCCLVYVACVARLRALHIRKL